MDKNSYNAFLNLMDSLQDEITIGNLLDGIEESTNFRPTPKDFEALGEGGRYISGIFEKYKRLYIRFKEINDKSKYYYQKIYSIILENYDKFTIEEKTYLYIELKKYDLSTIKFASNNDMYNINSLYSSTLQNSINIKTNYLFNKYFFIIKMTYKQLYLEEKGYDLNISNEYIKKLRINRKKF